MGGKRMRGFGLGPPGMDEARFGFYDGMGAPDFGYPGGPGGRFGGGGDGFFPGPGGPPPNMNFNPTGEILVHLSRPRLGADQVIGPMGESRESVSWESGTMRRGLKQFFSPHIQI